MEYGDTHNIQRDNSAEGMKAKENGYGGCATTEKDLHHSNSKAREEIPEAAQPIIGMNDERGAVSSTRNRYLRREWIAKSEALSQA